MPKMPQRSDYAPYDTLPEFDEGVNAYSAQNYNNPHGASSVAAQAWDRGLEFGMKLDLSYLRTGS
jgi:hypothetical protein